MYTTFYNLSAKPFQLSPDPRFFFGSTGHKRAMSYLRYGLSQGEGFIVITGDIGAGKTTLVRNLFSELNVEEVVAAQLVTTQLEADDMLRMVVAAFNLEHRDASKAVLIKRLEDFLASAARAGKRVLLVVDEAQNLPPRSLEELRMLSNFQIADRPLLQSFLLGQNEFRETLQSPGLEQLRQRIIASCNLTPLGPAETREYIEHRLSVVGWKDDPDFQPGAYAAIHEVSAGVPRRINVLCDRILLYGFLEQLHEIGVDDVREVDQELREEAGLGRPDERPPTRPQETAQPSSAQPSPVADGVTSSSTGNGAVEKLERRIEDLEAIVESLRKGFIELTRLIGRSPPP